MWIVFREMCIALIIIILFALFGNALLSLLSISNETIYLGGGIVLFMISVKMIFPQKSNLADSLSCDGEPFIFPLAVPLVAGPSILASVMIYSKQLESLWILLSSIFIAWIISMIILLSSTILKKWLGGKGISALERLMGFVLMLLAINMFIDGLEVYWQNGKH